jgi:hypothetical protein
MAIAAVQWIRSRPADDPAADRLLFLVAPVLWFIKHNRR